MNSTQKTKRYSVRCSLCKTRFMTELDETETTRKHAATCEPFRVRLAARIERTTRMVLQHAMTVNVAGIERGELYQMRCSCLSFDRIKGYKVETVPCDARCTGARGHNCECSCGGANHGQDNAISHGMNAPKLQEVA